MKMNNFMAVTNLSESLLKNQEKTQQEKKYLILEKKKPILPIQVMLYLILAEETELVSGQRD